MNVGLAGAISKALPDIGNQAIGPVVAWQTSASPPQVPTRTVVKTVRWIALLHCLSLRECLSWMSAWWFNQASERGLSGMGPTLTSRPGVDLLWGIQSSFVRLSPL